MAQHDINKGRWTKEENKIFMQEYEKYGKKCMQIAKRFSALKHPLKLKSMLNVSSNKIKKNSSSEMILRVPLSR
jgi:hypothetical protein